MTTPRRALRRSRAILTVAAVAVLAACSSEPVIPEGPYADEIRTAQASATSEFEEEAFADGVITREEYTEALDRWVACMADLGLTAGLVPGEDGTFTYTIASANGNIDAQDDTCREKSVGNIETIYTSMLQNPEKLTGPELVRNCLIAAEALDPAVTVDEVNEDLGPIIDGASTLVDNADPDVTHCSRYPYPPYPGAGTAP